MSVNIPNLGKRRTLGPRKDDLHELVLERLEILFLVQCQFAFLRHLRNDSGLLLNLTVRLGKLFLERRDFAALFLEDEATQACCTLLRRQFVEKAIEEQFAEHQLIARADFTSNTGFELNNIGIVDEAQSTQDTFPALQFVQLNHRQGTRNVFLYILDLIAERNLVRILAVQLG